MAIVYSYPQALPTLDDMIIGTKVDGNNGLSDNQTVNYTVSSLISLISLMLNHLFLANIIKFLFFLIICILLKRGKKFLDLYFVRFFGYLNILDFKTLTLCVGLNLST